MSRTLPLVLILKFAPQAKTGRCGLKSVTDCLYCADTDVKYIKPNKKCAYFLLFLTKMLRCAVLLVYHLMCASFVVSEFVLVCDCSSLIGQLLIIS